MKKKLIFFTLFILLSLITTATLYDKYDVIYLSELQSRDMSYTASDDIAELMYDRIISSNPEYQIITIDGELDSETLDRVNNVIVRRPVNNYNYLLEDENFNYRVYKGNEIIESYGNVNKEGSLFYGVIEADNGGFYEKEGQLYYDIFYYMNEDIKESAEISKNIIADENVEVKLNFPSDYRFEYSINEGVYRSWDSRLGAALASSFDSTYIVISMMIIAGIALIFGLFYPVRYLREINPFKICSDTKAELTITVLTAMSTLLGAGCLLIMKITIDKEFYGIINALGFTGYDNEIIFVINYLVYGLFMLTVVADIYYLKYMFTGGFGRFLKEDTLIALCIRKIKGFFNRLYDIDFEDNNIRKMLIIFIVNLVIVVIIGIIPGFGAIFGVAYVLVIALLVYDRYKVIENDYQKILNYASRVAKGDFDNLNEDMGIFDPLKNELSSIETGFKEAIREETASQSMKTELISNVSHDLKTPLTGIRNYTELLNDENLDPIKRQEYLEMLDKYSSRLESLIEDLFEISKANSGNIELDMLNLDVIELIRQVISEREDDLRDNNLELVFNSSSEKAICYLDSDKTYRIFDNLLNNIVKYSLNNTRVYIDINRIADQLVVTFKNISKSEMNFTPEEIVERFKRGDKSRSESGSGIGLAIVQSFTEAMNVGFKIETDGDLFKAILIFNINEG